MEEKHARLLKGLLYITYFIFVAVVVAGYLIIAELDQIRKAVSHT